MECEVSISHCFSNFLIIEGRSEAIKREVRSTYFGRGASCSREIDILRVILIEIPITGKY